MRLRRPILQLFFAAVVVASSAIHAQTPTEESTEESPQAELAPSGSRPAYAGTAKEKIKQVLAEPELKHTETVTTFRFKTSKPPEKDNESSLDGIAKIIGKIASFIARMSELALWAGAAILVFLLIAYRERWLRFLGLMRRRKSEITPLLQTSTPLPGGRLPDDIPGTVLKLWQQNEKAAALSILYRGTLAALEKVHRLVLPNGATELEVLQAVTLRQPNLRDYVAMLTAAWQCLAYAHRPPEQITGLVDGYRRHFEAPQP